MAIIHRITTDDTLVDDLRASLRQRGAIWDGTVASLFAAISAFGVTGGDRVAVNVGFDDIWPKRIVVEQGHDGVWEVRGI